MYVKRIGTRLGALLLLAALLLGGCGKAEPASTPVPSGPYAGISINPVGDAKKIETGELRAPVLVVLQDGDGIAEVVHSLSGPFTDDPAQAATTVFLYEASYYDGNEAERYRKEDNAWKAYVNVLNESGSDYLRLATDSEEWGENGQVCFKTPNTCAEDRHAREQMYLEFLRSTFRIGETASFDSRVVGALLGLGELPEASYQRVYELLNINFVGDPDTWDKSLALQTAPELVPGDALQITLVPKGFGSENMSRLAMLKPADGIEGVKRFVIDSVFAAGSNPCPPVVIGVGIGGTFDKVAALAKHALLRPIDRPHPDPFYARLERELLQAVNELGIGPQGFGGRTTALGLSIETLPTHVAGLPVAVNVSCHVTRRASGSL